MCRSEAQTDVFLFEEAKQQLAETFTVFALIRPTLAPICRPYISAELHSVKFVLLSFNAKLNMGFI